MWEQSLREDLESVGSSLDLLYRMTLGRDLTSMSVCFIFCKVVIIILDLLGYPEDSISKCACQNSYNSKNVSGTLRRVWWCTSATRGSSATAS